MTDVSLREPTFLILTALAAGAQHGYGIMTDVAEISGGRVRLRAGSLYAALNRLVMEGLVEFDREEIVDGRLRRYYRLTPSGAQRLAVEVEQLSRNTAVAEAAEQPGMTSEDGQQETGIAMNDHFRVSDADRDRAAALLRVHFAAGRLTADEMDDRIAATLAATTRPAAGSGRSSGDGDSSAG
jgi:DNA-binding PadR family transcriptional regulator